MGGDLWTGDVCRYLRTNLAAHDGAVWLLTVTAPGAGTDVPLWNRSAPGNWSALHRLASRRAREASPVGGAAGSFKLLARVWQLQRRGALHLHVVVAFGTPAEKAAAWVYVRELRRLGPGFGFGFIDARDRGRGSTVMEGLRAAIYLSKYLGESSQLRRALPWVARPVYVARALTLATGCTMRRLRRVRFLWWIRRGASSVVARAGRLPVWFRDARELQLVSSLAAASQGP